MNEISSKKSIEKLYEGSQSVKGKIILKAFRTFCSVPEEQPRIRCEDHLLAYNLRPRNMHFSPLLKNRSRGLASAKPQRKTASSHNRTLKQFSGQKKASDVMSIVRSFFSITLKFYSIPAVPLEFFEELAYVSNLVNKVEFSEKTQIQGILNDLESLPIPELTEDLKSSIQKFTKCSASPFLHNIENKLSKGIAKLTAKYISNLLKSPNQLLRSLITLLNVIDLNVILSKEDRFSTNITGKILNALKKLPKMIRNNEIGEHCAKRAKQLMRTYQRKREIERLDKEQIEHNNKFDHNNNIDLNDNIDHSNKIDLDDRVGNHKESDKDNKINQKNESDKLGDFMVDVFCAIKLYKMLYAKTPKKNTNISSSIPDKTQILDQSQETSEFPLFEYKTKNASFENSKACLLQQFLRGCSNKPVLNNSLNVQNNCPYGRVLSAKNQRPVGNLARRRPFKRRTSNK